MPYRESRLSESELEAYVQQEYGPLSSWLAEVAMDAIATAPSKDTERRVVKNALSIERGELRDAA